MMRSLYSAVSGLKTHQTRMDVIGNNIANVNTEAFKASSVRFSEIMYQTTSGASSGNGATGTGGKNAKQIGLGVKSGATAVNITGAGSAETTGNPFDLRLNDKNATNFFVVSDGTNRLFTRAGDFYVDGNGYLCMSSTGYTLQGWQVDAKGNVIKDTVSSLQVMSSATKTSAPEATTKAYVSGVLDKNDAQAADTGRIITIGFFDDLGYNYTAKFGIKKTNTDGTYDVTLKDIVDSKGNSIFDVDKDGNFITSQGPNGQTMYSYKGRAVDPQTIIEPARVITITSGKGGVGKSNTSVNLAVWLSRLGKRVIIFDADFGLANVEVMFGVIPKYTLADVIYENQTIKSIISNGPLGIDFISAGSSVVGLNNLNHKQIHFIVSAINELNSMYDFIIIDTGAGVSEQVMEFVAASNEIVLVTTPEPTSITDSYSLLKALYKRPDFDPSKVCIRVISNRAASKEDGSIVFNKINSVVMQFLNGSLEYLGYVPSDAMVEKAVRQQKILSIYDPTSKAARSFEEIAKRLLDNESAALDEKRTISHIFSNFFNRKQ